MATRSKGRSGRGAVLARAGAALAAALWTACSVRDAPQEYFLLTPDRRLCVSPLCGGEFLQALNEDATQCVEGSLAARCYVTRVDWSALGGAPLLAAPRILVRGTIEPTDVPNFGTLGVLSAREAWGSATADEPTGAFERLADRGRRCDAAACLATEATPLNGGPSFPLSELDLGAVPASPDALADARRALARGELIASGNLVPAPSAGLRLAASQFFVPLARACASSDACDTEQYCSSASFCEADGHCRADADCRADGNDYAAGDCGGQSVCEGAAPGTPGRCRARCAAVPASLL